MASSPSREASAPATPPWLTATRVHVLDAVEQFIDAHCAPALARGGVDAAEPQLRGMLADGKCLRSTFLYVGWRCGADHEPAAIRAAASLEFLHVFALVQDDVMDESAVRRGRPAAHRVFEAWHGDRGLPGSSARFGESAAVLLGDLCLVWAEQMLRDSGLDADALARAWPRYDAMRTELAAGQFADLVNDTGGFPGLDDVLDVARRKSGNYTVRRPLEIGAALADCDDEVLTALAVYGTAVGEAFQMRDDLLGVFGSPQTTGKPAGTDLLARKATTVVVAAYELATGARQRHLKELMTAEHLSRDDVAAWRHLITDVGAVALIEDLIRQRHRAAVDTLAEVPVDEDTRSALLAMAAASTERAA
jgi:geranylgeranyl diphosphate synthase, type I